MRLLSPVLRSALYLLAGGLVGFLFLGEFAMATIPAVQLALAVLALLGLVGALRGARTLEQWPLFVCAAMVVPIAIDARIVGLPRCPDVPPGVACLAGGRDIAGQFAVELLIFATAICGVAVLATRVSRAALAGGPDN